MKKLVLAGFGGQGVLSLGQFLASSGLKEGKEVSYLPAYGPEMRGGTANCSVVISEKIIASPLCTTPDILVAMNTPSLIKFRKKVKSGGIIIVNSSLIEIPVERDDVNIYLIPANDLAITAGNSKAANMVMAGAVVAASDVVSEKSIYECISDKFGFKASLVEINDKAYRAGYEAVKNYKK
jgi:2-oxoglutarate ferredoxin oxidoreductase subunit gamma